MLLPVHVAGDLAAGDGGGDDAAARDDAARAGAAHSLGARRDLLLRSGGLDRADLVAAGRFDDDQLAQWNPAQRLVESDDVAAGGGVVHHDRSPGAGGREIPARSSRL